MRLVLDRERCQGHGRCYSTAPDAFEPDEEGYAVLIAPDVAGSDRDRAIAVARSCPERAISVELDG
jgi:ferredoxin